MTEWIGADEAARRLGIKPASLYAYVSRGVLRRHRAAGGRTSLFDAEDVAELARRGRPRRRVPAGTDLVIESSITDLAPDRLAYRGQDVPTLARERRFEEVAELLWGLSVHGPGSWRATAAALATGRAAQSALPETTLPLERLQVIVPALAATDPLRLHLEPPAIVTAGRALIAGMVDCLPAARSAPTEWSAPAERSAPAARPARDPLSHAAGPSDGGYPSDSIAARLATRLCPEPVPPRLSIVLNAALVLLADHELAASTLAARVAASMRADPYAVVGTGLGAVSGALHGGAALAAETMLESARGPAEVPRVIGEVLRRGERVPGFGHFVYQSADPRAVTLLVMLREHFAATRGLAVTEAVLAEARSRALPAPNIEIALAALTAAAGLVRGAGEAIFAIARTAGWLAHALEEYVRATPIRPRGVYVGLRSP